ncbi:cob(I)yrinic acid a,c-diamide adenosyltransferase [soil metagenome]
MTEYERIEAEMRLFTGKGDQGKTDLLGDRVGKDDPRIGLIGALDEGTSFLGFARALSGDTRTNEWSVEVQRDLYQIMAELAFIDELRPDAYVLKAERVARLEELTDTLSAEIELPRQFIVPGETVAGGAFDVARTVIRRAEREAVTLATGGTALNAEILRYLNRLSSLLFMLARLAETSEGVSAPKAKERRRLGAE